MIHRVIPVFVLLAIFYMLSCPNKDEDKSPQQGFVWFIMKLVLSAVEHARYMTRGSTITCKLWKWDDVVKPEFEEEVLLKFKLNLNGMCFIRYTILESSHLCTTRCVFYSLKFMYKISIIGECVSKLLLSPNKYLSKHILPI